MEQKETAAEKLGTPVVEEKSDTETESEDSDSEFRDFVVTRNRAHAESPTVRTPDNDGTREVNQEERRNSGISRGTTPRRLPDTPSPAPQTPRRLPELPSPAIRNRPRRDRRPPERYRDENWVTHQVVVQCSNCSMCREIFE